MTSTEENSPAQWLSSINCALEHTLIFHGNAVGSKLIFVLRQLLNYSAYTNYTCKRKFILDTTIHLENIILIFIVEDE